MRATRLNHSTAAHNRKEKRAHATHPRAPHALQRTERQQLLQPRANNRRYPPLNTQECLYRAIECKIITTTPERVQRHQEHLGSRGGRPLTSSTADAIMPCTASSSCHIACGAVPDSSAPASTPASSSRARSITSRSATVLRVPNKHGPAQANSRVRYQRRARMTKA